MKKNLNILFLIFTILFSFSAFSKEQPVIYTIDLRGPSTDTFLVSLKVKGLSADNDIYQFASTAPGTYQVMDIGRFVNHFKAFDKKGNEIKTEKVSVNQYRIADPAKVDNISYKVAETWDTPVSSMKIWRMSGSSLEKDHALLSIHCILGYFKGHQEQDMKIKLEYPQDWSVGTALKKDKKGYFEAPDYDFAVDSPILAGKLSNATLDLNGRKIEIFTYSKTGMIKSSDLLTKMDTMLRAANSFLVQLPVDRYVFLFHFEDVTTGAWEHSYSSTYIYKEDPLTSEFTKQIISIAAHEFFHVVTPLNIHSEIIENFNFVTPTASEHLWLYEGTTEWASDVMQLRYGTMDLEEFLEQIYEKLNVDDKLDKTYSLSKISLTSYTPEGQKQYYNVYNRGALVATLLDIRLLELSGGKKGFRELILDLAKEFGPSKSFPEGGLFDIVVSKTYPEIKEFIEKYIKNAEPLPIAEYFGKIGVEYIPELKTGNTVPKLGFDIAVSGDGFTLVQLDSTLSAQGLKDGDEPTLLDDIPFDMEHVPQIQQRFSSLKLGDPFSITVRRNGEKITGKTTLQGEEQVFKHVLRPMEKATPEQLTLREKWMQNLPYDKK
jgi:predicted metalloprotease with PDZ domain